MRFSCVYVDSLTELIGTFNKMFNSIATERFQTDFKAFPSYVVARCITFTILLQYQFFILAPAAIFHSFVRLFLTTKLHFLINIIQREMGDSNITLYPCATFFFDELNEFIGLIMYFYGTYLLSISENFLSAGFIYDKNINAFINRIYYGASLLRIEQNSMK